MNHIGAARSSRPRARSHANPQRVAPSNSIRNIKSRIPRGVSFQSFKYQGGLTSPKPIDARIPLGPNHTWLSPHVTPCDLPDHHAHTAPATTSAVNTAPAYLTARASAFRVRTPISATPEGPATPA